MSSSFSTECLLVVYRPDLQQLAGRWLRPISEEELHQGYEALLQAARHHDCRHWLIDSRRRTNRSLNGPDWVVAQYLPRVQAALGGRLCVCFLVLPAYLSSLGDVPPPAPHSPVQFARFVDEGAANAWLATWQITQ